MRVDRATSRRQFLKFLAASPLFASSLPAFAEGPVPGVRLPDPLMWAPLTTDKLIKSPKDAINVFDFEPVCARQRSAGAFRLHGLGHRRRSHAARQPRGLPEVSAAAAPAGRRQQGRHEHRHSRREIRLADHHRAGRRPAMSFHEEGEVAVAKAAKAGNHLQILSTVTNIGIEDVTAARGAAALVPALCDQQMGRRQGDGGARRKGRLPRRRRDGRPLRRTQPGDPVPAAIDRHARVRRLPRARQPRDHDHAARDVPGRRHVRASPTRSRPR